MSSFATVDDYIAAQPQLAQAHLRELRAAVQAALPGAAETVSYGMPTYRLGRARVHFGAAKNHCALYGAIPDGMTDEVKGYETAKGTIRFPLDQPIPSDLVSKLVQARLIENRTPSGEDSGSR